MTQTITGNVGTRFDITVCDTATCTGQEDIAHQIESTVGDLTLTDDDYIISLCGTVGTTAIDGLDLNALSYITGTGYVLNARTNLTQPVDLTTIKNITIHNKGTVEVITISDATATSFLPASEQITIKPGASAVIYNGPDFTIGVNGQIKIVSDTASTPIEIYIAGA